MRVPSSLLRQHITISPYLGDSSYGPRWGTPVTVRARVQGKRQVIRRPDGTEVTVTASATIRPGVPVDLPARSKVTWEGRTYEVVGDVIGHGLSDPAYVELMLA